MMENVIYTGLKVASEKIRQTHQWVVPYGETDEKEVRISSLEREIEDLRREYRQQIQSFEMALKRRDREVQDLLKHSARLRRTIIALKTDRESMSREASELRWQIQGSRDRLAEALIEKLDREVHAKVEQIETLQAEIENLRRKTQLSVQTPEKDDVFNSLPQEHSSKTLLEKAKATRRIVVKVTCPHCKGRISGRLKAELKQGEDAFGEDEPSSSFRREIEELWGGYEQKLRTHKVTVRKIHPIQNRTEAY